MRGAFISVVVISTLLLASIAYAQNVINVSSTLWTQVSNVNVVGNRYD